MILKVGKSEIRDLEIDCLSINSDQREKYRISTRKQALDNKISKSNKVQVSLDDAPAGKEKEGAGVKRTRKRIAKRKIQM